MASSKVHLASWLLAKAILDFALTQAQIIADISAPAAV
jgi:hypothetical protein